MSEKMFKALFGLSFATGGVIGWFGVRKILKKVLEVN